MGISSSSVELWQNLSLAGRGFSVITGFVNVPNTNETDFLLVRNPMGSKKLVKLKEFLFTIGATASQNSIFRFYRSPTITGVGTELTIQKVLPSSDISSGIQVSQLPTISDKGTLIQMFSVGLTTFPRDQELARYLVEGADLLITIKGSNNNIEHSITMVWAE